MKHLVIVALRITADLANSRALVFCLHIELNIMAPSEQSVLKRFHAENRQH